MSYTQERMLLFRVAELEKEVDRLDSLVETLGRGLLSAEGLVLSQGKAIVALQVAVARLQVPDVVAVVIFSIPTTQNKEHGAMTTVKDSDPPFTATLVLDDAKGVVTTADSPPVWVADDAGAVLTLAVAADGMSAVGTPVAPGTSNITITITDADGTVVPPVLGQVVVVGGEAASGVLTITPGTAPAADPTTPAP